MIASYFKIAIRKFIKDKSVSLVSLASLVLAMASVIIIFNYVLYELSYDRHYTNSQSTYRIITETSRGGKAEESINTNIGVAPALKREFPEVAQVTHSSAGHNYIIKYRGENVALKPMSVSAGFFEVFNLAFKYGNPANALNGNNKIVITEHIANAYFPGRDPLGETITNLSFTGSREMIISGVIKDIPLNTHFNADIIVSSNDSREGTLGWDGYISVTQYFTLSDNASVERLKNKLGSFYKKYHFPPGIRLIFQPVTSIHLYSHIADERSANGDIRYIYIFSLTAILILVLACINYINLTTARSLYRVKEVGVRKIMGAGNRQLVMHFIGESLLFFLIAVPFAFLLAYLAWPQLMKILNIDIGYDSLLALQTILMVLGITGIAGLVSGFFPSYFLLRLDPVTALKNWSKTGGMKFTLRKGLIVFQFVISVSLIIAVIVIRQQLSFINNMPLGFNKDNLIALPENNFGNHFTAFKNTLKQNPAIKSVTSTSWEMGEYYGASSSMENPNDTLKQLNFDFLDADFDFLETLQIRLKRGRNFSLAFPSDVLDYDSILSSKKHFDNEELLNILGQRPIILSESTVKSLQLTDPVGTVLKLGALQGTVIGVVDDFQGVTLRKPTAALVLRAKRERVYGYTYIRVVAKNFQATLQNIQEVWKDFYPESRFDFSFVDEKLEKLYQSEKRLASIFTIFTILAVLIACSGLFSLVALTVQHRTREIGIRKVLGAGVLEIVKLIMRDFALLILLSIIIASPIAWIFMNSWLEDFAFRVNVSWWIFLLAGLLTICVSLITIFIQAIRAAVGNPVNNLRTE